MEDNSEICRLCGNNTNDLSKDIFEDLTLLKNINLIIPLNIDENDKLPRKICTKCFNNLTISVDMVNKAIDTDRKLRKSKMKPNYLPINGPILCDICHVKFVDMLLFDKHMKKHVEKEEIPELEDMMCMNICCKCGFAYNSKEEYEEHKSRSIKSCLSCKRKFVSSCIFYGHVCKKYIPKIQMSPYVVDIPHIENKPKTENKYLWSCKFCGKVVTTKVSLDIHLRIHSNQKPYICEYCGKIFRSKSNLNQHIAMHTGMKNYLCPVCNKKFSRKSFVKTHMRVHTGEKPFKCEICGIGYSQIGDKRRHMAKHEKQINKARSPGTYRKILPMPVLTETENDILCGSIIV